MKKVIQILAIALVILLPVILSAQPMPWGGDGYGGGEGTNPVGGSNSISDTTPSDLISSTNALGR